MARGRLWRLSLAMDAEPLRAHARAHARMRSSGAAACVGVTLEPARPAPPLPCAPLIGRALPAAPQPQEFPLVPPLLGPT